MDCQEWSDPKAQPQHRVLPAAGRRRPRLDGHLVLWHHRGAIGDGDRGQLYRPVVRYAGGRSGAARRREISPVECGRAWLYRGARDHAARWQPAARLEPADLAALCGDGGDEQYHRKVSRAQRAAKPNRRDVYDLSDAVVADPGAARLAMAEPLDLRRSDRARLPRDDRTSFCGAGARGSRCKCLRSFRIRPTAVCCADRVSVVRRGHRPVDLGGRCDHCRVFGLCCPSRGSARPAGASRRSRVRPMVQGANEPDRHGEEGEHGNRRQAAIVSGGGVGSRPRDRKGAGRFGRQGRDP